MNEHNINILNENYNRINSLNEYTKQRKFELELL